MEDDNPFSLFLAVKTINAINTTASAALRQTFIIFACFVLGMLHSFPKQQVL